jgi:hypothetical protein
MDGYKLSDNKIFALKRSHKTLKVKREVNKVKAVYLLGSDYQVQLVAEVLDLDEQTVRQYFLDYKNRDRNGKKKNLWVAERNGRKRTAYVLTRIAICLVSR